MKYDLSLICVLGIAIGWFISFIQNSIVSFCVVMVMLILSIILLVNELKISKRIREEKEK